MLLLRKADTFLCPHHFNAKEISYLSQILDLKLLSEFLLQIGNLLSVIPSYHNVIDIYCENGTHSLGIHNGMLIEYCMISVTLFIALVTDCPTESVEPGSWRLLQSIQRLLQLAHLSIR